MPVEQIRAGDEVVARNSVVGALETMGAVKNLAAKGEKLLRNSETIFCAFQGQFTHCLTDESLSCIKCSSKKPASEKKPSTMFGDFGLKAERSGFSPERTVSA